MDRMVQLIVAVVIIIIAIVVFAAVVSFAPQQEENVKIGAILPLSGPLSGVGEVVLEGMLLAREDINKNGGINGITVEIVIEDTQSDPASVIKAFRKLSDVDGIDIMTTATSSHSLVAKPLAEENHVLLFAGAAHPDITKNSNFVFRHSNVIDEDATTLSDALDKNNYTSVGIIYVNDDWGTGFETVLRSILEENNIKIVSEKHLREDTDFRTQLTKIMSASPEAIVDISAGPPAGLIIKQLRELGFEGDIYTSVGFVLTPDAKEIAGDSISGVFYQNYHSNPEFVSSYTERFDKDPSGFSESGYTTIEIIAAAIRNTKSGNSSVLADHIRNMGEFHGRYATVIVEQDGDIPLKTFVEQYE